MAHTIAHLDILASLLLAGVLFHSQSKSSQQIHMPLPWCGISCPTPSVQRHELLILSSIQPGHRVRSFITACARLRVIHNPVFSISLHKHVSRAKSMFHSFCCLGCYNVVDTGYLLERMLDSRSEC